MTWMCTPIFFCCWHIEIVNDRAMCKKYFHKMLEDHLKRITHLLNIIHMSHTKNSRCRHKPSAKLFVTIQTLLYFFKWFISFFLTKYRLKILCLVLNKNMYSFRTNMMSIWVITLIITQTFFAEIMHFESFINAENIIVIAGNYW